MGEWILLQWVKLHFDLNVLGMFFIFTFDSGIVEYLLELAQIQVKDLSSLYKYKHLLDENLALYHTCQSMHSGLCMCFVSPMANLVHSIHYV